ncbi:MAG: YihY/virulence factor BrkB family protein [Pseudomonadota bacterium]
MHLPAWRDRSHRSSQRKPFRAPWRLSWGELLTVIKEAGGAWVDDRAPSLGAALSYYTLFSLAPLLLIVIAVAGAVFGVEAAEGAVFEQFEGFIGAPGALAVQGLLESVRRHDQSAFGTAVGTVLLLIGATSVFAELQSALDKIWRVPPQQARPSWLVYLRTRLLSFGLVLGLGFLLTVSLVASAGLSAWSAWWAPAFSGWTTLLMVVNFTVSFCLTALLFAMIYKMMPSVHIAWRDVALGAVATALLFAAGKTLIGFYIGTSGVATGFGAASSIVVLLVWVYYSAQVFLVGAELTSVYARRYGSLSPAPR